MLLKGDLCKLACMRIDVAAQILHHPQLQLTGRIDSHFSSLICKTYPTLAIDIFSSNKISAPEQDDIIEIIQTHPFLFAQLIDQEKFIRWINKSLILVKLALIDQNIALSIWNNRALFNKFDAYHFIDSVGLQYEDFALQMLNDSTYAGTLDDYILFSYGERYIEAAKIIIEDRRFTVKLSDKRLEKLQDKVIEHALSLTM